MQNVLFHYRRKVSEDQVNDNYINPLNVLSFYWSVNDKEVRVLSVFLSNGFSIVFGEKVGDRFVQHMEEFLRYLLAAKAITAAPANRPADGRRRNLNPAEIVEDSELVEGEPATEAAWQG